MGMGNKAAVITNFSVRELAAPFTVAVAGIHCPTQSVNRPGQRTLRRAMRVDYSAGCFHILYRTGCVPEP